MWTNWSYMCKCDAKTGAMKTDRVWWTILKRLRSATCFWSNHAGKLEICRLPPVKMFWCNSVFVNTLKEQKSDVSGNRSCQQSSINDTQGWSLNVKRWALYFRHGNLCLMALYFIFYIATCVWWLYILDIATCILDIATCSNLCLKNMLPCRIPSQI